MTRVCFVCGRAAPPPCKRCGAGVVDVVLEDAPRHPTKASGARYVLAMSFAFGGVAIAARSDGALEAALGAILVLIALLFVRGARRHELIARGVTVRWRSAEGASHTVEGAGVFFGDELVVGSGRSLGEAAPLTLPPTLRELRGALVPAGGKIPRAFGLMEPGTGHVDDADQAFFPGPDGATCFGVAVALAGLVARGEVAIDVRPERHWGVGPFGPWARIGHARAPAVALRRLRAPEPTDDPLERAMLESLDAPTDDPSYRLHGGGGRLDATAFAAALRARGPIAAGRSTDIDPRALVEALPEATRGTLARVHRELTFAAPADRPA